MTYEFDVALTFAGEDRVFVESVVNALRKSDISVFYDEDFAVDWWGKDLTEYFGDVYERRARYAVMFVSRHYAEKPWTNLERKSVLARALEQVDSYLLPVRLDSSKLAGVRSTLGFLDGHRLGALGVAQAILEKVGAPTPVQTPEFDRVPATKEELALLLGARPKGWEYAALAFYLREMLVEYENDYEDFRIGYAIPSEYLPDSEVNDVLQEGNAQILGAMNLLEKLLLGPAQEEAIGKPGEAGDPERIQRLARHLTSLYRELIGWAQRIRSYAPESEEARAVLLIKARYAEQPVVAYRTFVAEYVEIIDDLLARLSTGQELNVNQQLELKYTVPPALAAEFEVAAKAFSRSRR